MKHTYIQVIIYEIYATIFETDIYIYTEFEDILFVWKFNQQTLHVECLHA